MSLTGFHIAKQVVNKILNNCHYGAKLLTCWQQIADMLLTNRWRVVDKLSTWCQKVADMMPTSCQHIANKLWTWWTHFRHVGNKLLTCYQQIMDMLPSCRHFANNLWTCCQQVVYKWLINCQWVVMSPTSCEHVIKSSICRWQVANKSSTNFQHSATCHRITNKLWTCAQQIVNMFLHKDKENEKIKIRDFFCFSLL